MKKTFKQIKIEKIDEFIAKQFMDKKYIIETRRLNHVEFRHFLSRQKQFIIDRVNDYVLESGVGLDDEREYNKVVAQIIDRYAKEFRSEYYNQKGWSL